MMNYLDYINKQPVMKAFFGNKMPKIDPNDKESVKKMTRLSSSKWTYDPRTS